MSTENVELAHRAFQAFNDRDLDAFLGLMSDEVEAIPIIAAMEGGCYRGHDGIRRWWEQVLGAFPDFQAEVVHVRDRPDVTVVTLHMQGHAAGSDTPVDAMGWQLSRWRQGKCTRWQMYASEPEALDAAGLSDPPQQGKRIMSDSSDPP